MLKNKNKMKKVRKKERKKKNMHTELLRNPEALIGVGGTKYMVTERKLTLGSDT